MDNNPAVNINAMGVIERATAEGLDAGLIRLKILFKNLPILVGLILLSIIASFQRMASALLGDN